MQDLLDLSAITRLACVLGMARDAEFASVLGGDVGGKQLALRDRPVTRHAHRAVRGGAEGSSEELGAMEEGSDDVGRLALGPFDDPDDEALLESMTALDRPQAHVSRPR